MNIIILVGPPGSGKSTLAKNYQDYVYVNQDMQGKNHLAVFQEAIKNKQNVIIDRMNFDKKQRARYLNPAIEAEYSTNIIVLHENYETCLKRCNARDDHLTIHTEEDARSALGTFFKLYERPSLDEANMVEYRYPEINMSTPCVIIDIDGTAANIDHRLHFMKRTEGKRPDWKSFLSNFENDSPNLWCREIVNNLREKNNIIFCSGRPDSFKKVTKEWLDNNRFMNDWLFMRPRNDHRDDTIIKEIILDFEILTRFKSVKFAIDDRQRIVDMWRKRGIVTLQCEKGDF